MEFLLKQFKKLEDCLKHFREKLEEKGLELSPEEQQLFDEIRQAIYNCKESFQETYNEEISSGNPSTKLQTELLSEHFNDFKAIFDEQFRSFEENGPLYTPEFVMDLIEFKDTVSLINSYGEMIQEAANPDSENQKISDIMDYPTWIRDLFHDDPGIAQNRVSATEHWNVQEHSFQENLEQYRNDMITVHNNYYKHLMDVTGDSKTPLKKLGSKIKLLSDFLDDYYKEEAKPEIGALVESHKQMQNMLNPEKVELISQKNLVGKQFFEDDKGIDEANLLGDLERKKSKKRALPKETIQAVMDEIHKLRFKSYNIGTDANTLERMGRISELLTMPSFLHGVLLQANNFKDPLEVQGHPMQTIVKKLDLIDSKTRKFLNSGNADVAPTMDDYDILFDYLADYVNTCNQFSDTKGNGNIYVGTIMNGCRRLAILFPERYTDRLTQAENNYASKIELLYKDQFKKLCTCSLELNGNGSDPISDAWNSIKTLQASGKLSQDDYEKAYFVRLARDSAFRDTEMATMAKAIEQGTRKTGINDTLDGIKTLNNDGSTRTIAERVTEANRRYLMCRQLSLECDTLIDFSKTARTAADQLQHPYDHRISDAFSNDPLDASQVQAIDQYYVDFINHPETKRMINFTAQQMHAAIGTGDKAFYGNEGNFVSTIEPEILDALTQQDSGNSEEYNALFNTLGTVSLSSHHLGGTGVADFQALFSACRTYLHTHDSDPTTKNGQIRFDMTARLLVQVGMEMMDKFPETREEIEKEFYLETIRSKMFRDYCVEGAEKILASMCGGKMDATDAQYNLMTHDQHIRLNIARKIRDNARMVGRVLSEKAKKTMITGKCETSEKAENVLNEFNGLTKLPKKGFVDASGNALSPKETAFIKKIYGGIYDSYHKELSEEPNFKQHFYGPIVEAFEDWKKDFDIDFEKIAESSKPVNMEEFHHEQMERLWEYVNEVADRNDPLWNAFNKTYFQDFENLHDGKPQLKDTIEGLNNSMGTFKLTDKVLPGIETIVNYNPHEMDLNIFDEARKANSNTYRHITGADNEPAKQAVFGFNAATEYTRSQAIAFRDADIIRVDDIYEMFSSVNALLLTDTENGGKIRWEGITAGKIDGISSVAIPVEMYRLMNSIAEYMNIIKQTADPLVQKSQAVQLASFAYQMTVSQHIFADGNGRSCRMLSDAILQTFGLPPHTPHTGLINTGATIGNFFDYEKGTKAFLRGIQISDEIAKMSVEKDTRQMEETAKNLLISEQIPIGIMENMDAKQCISFAIQIRENKRILTETLQTMIMDDVLENEPAKEYKILKQVTSNVLNIISKESMFSEKSMRALDVLDSAIMDYETYCKNLTGDRTFIDSSIASLADLKGASLSMKNLAETVCEPMYAGILEKVHTIKDKIVQEGSSDRREQFAKCAIVQYVFNGMTGSNGKLYPDMCNDLLEMKSEVLHRVMEDADFKKAVSSFESSNPSAVKLSAKDLENVGNQFFAYKHDEVIKLRHSVSKVVQSVEYIRPAFMKSEAPVVHAEPKLQNKESEDSKQEKSQKVLHEDKNIKEASPTENTIVNPLKDTDNNYLWDKELGRDTKLIFDAPEAKEKVAPKQIFSNPELANFTSSLYFTLLSQRINPEKSYALDSILLYADSNPEGRTILEENISWQDDIKAMDTQKKPTDLKFLTNLYEQAKAGKLVFVKPGQKIEDARPVVVQEDGMVTFAAEKSPLVEQDPRKQDAEYANERLQQVRQLNVSDFYDKPGNYESLSIYAVLDAFEKGLSNKEFVDQLMQTRIPMANEPVDEYKKQSKKDPEITNALVPIPVSEQADRRKISETAFRNYFTAIYEANQIRYALRNLFEKGEISLSEVKEIDKDRDSLDVLLERGNTPEVVQRNQNRIRKYLGKHLNPDDPDFADKKLRAQAEVFNERMNDIADFDYDKFSKMSEREFAERFVEYHRAGKVLSVFKKVYNNTESVNPYIDKTIGQKLLNQEEQYGNLNFYNTVRIRAIANPAYEKLNIMNLVHMDFKSFDALDTFAWNRTDVNLQRLATDTRSMNQSKSTKIAEMLSSVMNKEKSGMMLSEQPLFYDEKGNELHNNDYFGYFKTGKPIYAARINEPDSLKAFTYNLQTDTLSDLPVNKYAPASVLNEMKTDIARVSEEKKQIIAELEQREATSKKNAEHYIYYKDKSEKYDTFLQSTDMLRVSLPTIINEMHSKNLSVEKYADDFAKRMYIEVPKKSYDEFCQIVGVPENEKLSIESIQHRKAVSAAAVKAVFAVQNNRVLGSDIGFTAKNIEGVSVRVFCAVMCEPGKQNLENNKKIVETMLNGSIKEKKQVVEDRFKELMKKCDSFLGKSFTDEELLDHMDELIPACLAVGMEMEGFQTCLNTLKKEGVVIDQGILDKMSVYHEKVYAFNNYYLSQIDYMTSQYYQFGARDRFMTNPDVQKYMTQVDDVEFGRTCSSINELAFSGEIAIGDALKEKLETKGKKIENFYDVSGKPLGTDSFTIANTYIDGGEVVVCYEGDANPQKLKLSDMHSLNMTITDGGEISATLAKQINSMRFDERLNAISKKNYDKQRLAFEESLLNEQYKLALCMDEAINANPEDSSFVKDITATLMAKLSIKRMIDQPGIPKAVIDELISDTSVDGLKQDVLKNALESEVIRVLPHTMDGILAMSSEQLNSIITEKNTQYLKNIGQPSSTMKESLKDISEAKQDEGSKEFEDTVDKFNADEMAEKLSEFPELSKDLLELEIPQSIKEVTGSEYEKSFFEESLDHPEESLENSEKWIEEQYVLEDSILDHQLSRFADQVVSNQFETELHALSDSFGNQSNPMDPHFTSLMGRLRELSEVYHDAQSNDELKLSVLRYTQNKAADYLEAHKEGLYSDAPKAGLLLAEKIFTLTGTQKIALRDGLQPGTVIKGNAEFKTHDLSLDHIRTLAPVKIVAKKMKSMRYSTMAKKHVNSKDELPDARKHLEEETTVNYSVIDQIKDSSLIKVHSGLGKKNSAEGGYNLEFVCAGSSNNQFVKSYKGHTGRNEIARFDLQHDADVQEIVDTIHQKYNMTFDTEEMDDNSRYEWAMEQEYGRPMFLDENKVLHEEEAPSSRLMLGIRKIQKGNTTRFNISGPLEKIFGFIGKQGFSNSGDYSIDNNKDYMIGLADAWLDNISKDYENKIQDGHKSDLKPINIMFKGHSRGAVAANEASMMINYLVEHKYPQLRDYIHISTHLLDPVPGIDSEIKHPETDMNRNDYNLHGRNLRGLKATDTESKNNASTVFYSIHSNHKVFFAPQSVKGTDRLIFSCMSHDSGVYDIVDDHKRGYLAENGEEYRGSGFNELPNGIYFIDENKNIVSCKNSQEAHKAVDAMLAKHKNWSRQWSRHGRVHDMIDAWFMENPEIITSKDTRYPVEQAMQEDRKALQDVLISFISTKPETEIATDVNVVLQRGISSLLAHQLLLDNWKKNEERIYPASVSETKKMLEDWEKTELPEKIRKSENFQLFYDSLNKEDIQVLASGDPKQLKSYLNNFRAITNMSPEVKQQIRNENLVLRSENQVGSKSMFFEKHLDDQGKWRKNVRNRIQLSVDRTALNIIAVSRLLRQGYSLKDIMDPFKLERQRQAMGDQVLHDYITMGNEKLAETFAKDMLFGFKQSLDEIDTAISKLSSISVEELSKPENNFILRSRDLIINFGQELGSKGKPIFDAAVKLSSNDQIQKLFDRQVTSNLVINRISEAQSLVHRMINHPETFRNPDETLVEVGGAVFTSMAIDDKFKELKLKEGNNFRFSESLSNAFKEKDVEACKTTLPMTQIYDELKDIITLKDDSEKLDKAQLQKLGREFQNGTLFAGKFSVQKAETGFAPLSDIDVLISNLMDKPNSEISWKDKNAMTVYNNTRHNIEIYEKVEKLATKIMEKQISMKDELQEINMNDQTLNEDNKGYDPLNAMVDEFNADQKQYGNDILESFLKEKISKAMRISLDQDHYEQAMDFCMTYGDDNIRNRTFKKDGNSDRITQIKEVLDNGGKVFITLPDMKYHTMDTCELVIKNGTPSLEIPVLEHKTMTESVREISKRINALGYVQNVSSEFYAFKNKLEDIATYGIPKNADSYYSTMYDLSMKAFEFGVKHIDQKLDAKQDACVTATSQILEMYRSVCMHEKPSKDGMNLSMIASKVYKAKLAEDIKSDNPTTAKNASETIGNYDKYVNGVAELINSKKFKAVFNGMSSKEIEKYAHKNADELKEFIQNEKKKTKEYNPLIK